MASEQQTEETRPAVSGKGIRQRVLFRLADASRNAWWIGLSAAGILLAVAAVFLYQAVTTRTWQLYVGAGLYFAGTLAGLVAAYLTRRGRHYQGMWILVATLLIVLAASPLFVSGVGILVAIGSILATLIISSLSFQRQQILPVNLLGVAGAVAALLIETYLQAWQASPSRWLVVVILAVVLLMAVIYLFILVTYFPTYSLRLKITITVFSAAILSIAMLSVANYISTQRALLNAVNQTLLLAAQEKTVDVDDHFRDLVDRVVAQTNAPIFGIYLTLPDEQRAGNIATYTYLLAQNSLLGAHFTALMDQDGRVLLHTLESDPSAIPLYLGMPDEVRAALEQTLSSGEPYLSPVIFSESDGTPYYLIGARVANVASQPLGILTAAFSLDALQQIMAAGNDTAGSGSYAILIDENGLQVVNSSQTEPQFQFLVMPEEEQFNLLVEAMRYPGIAYTESASAFTGFEAGLSQLAASPFFTVNDSSPAGGVNSVAATPLTTRPWTLAFLQSQTAILEPVVTQTRASLILAVVVTGLSVLAAILLARLVADPIVRLTAIAERAAGGNLYLQASAQSPDEIGTLATAFNSMINQLRQTLEGLETRVTERTTELIQTTEQMRYRANRLQMVAEIAHTIAAVQDPQELLPRVTEEINSRYGYYHVGVFLSDAEGKFAVLHAANSEGGKRMLARGHRLRIGEVGIVGYVAGAGQPRIALDVGKDAVFFDNPDLPDTRSEIALPLRTGKEVIGVLDVQSTESGAFSQDDIALLSALADQVAMAIQNTRLLDETRRTLRELQVAQQQYLSGVWSQLITERPMSGFEYTFGRISPISGGADAPGGEVGVESKATSAQVLTDQDGKLVIPIAVRGQVIGLIDLQEAEPGRVWSDDEIELARGVADQVGLALENARLLAETQRRAERERLVADITTKMRTSNSPQAILETAVVELRNALRVKSVQVRLQTIENSAGADDPGGTTSENPDQVKGGAA